MALLHDPVLCAKKRERSGAAQGLKNAKQLALADHAFVSQIMWFHTAEVLLFS